VTLHVSPDDAAHCTHSDASARTVTDNSIHYNSYYKQSFSDVWKYGSRKGRVASRVAHNTNRAETHVASVVKAAYIVETRACQHSTISLSSLKAVTGQALCSFVALPLSQNKHVSESAECASQRPHAITSTTAFIMSSRNTAGPLTYRLAGAACSNEQRRRTATCS
jgi:hypothetical protein